MQTVYLAGGCFWGMQRFFDQFDGVKETDVGYANGGIENPTYEQVCQNSGHAETVRITFDENIISLKTLLEYYFLTIDPTSVNRQGEDEGIQYRTGIYYPNASLLPSIREVCDAKAAELGRPLAVEVLPLDSYYPAEEYHQKYLVKNPAGYCHISGHLLHLERKSKEK